MSEIESTHEELFYIQEDHEFYTVDQLADMIDLGDIEETKEVTKCEYTNKLKMSLLDQIEDIIFDQFGEEGGLTKKHLLKIEELQKEIDLILKDYPSAIPTKEKIKVK
ncbi:MAG: hypothetical protein ACKOW2_02005, partial [Sphingobacteriaceae bacterium]